MNSLSRLFRRAWAALRPKEAILTRAMLPGDLPRLFPPRQLDLGTEWLAQQDRGELYVAVVEVSGVPAGRRCLNFTWNSREGAVFCFAFFVLDEFKSRGIGGLIERHSEAVARARGFHGLRVAIDKDNARGLAWHERLGYRTIGERVERWVDPDGAHESDCWIVERRWGSHQSGFSRFITRYQDGFARWTIRRRRSRPR